MKFLCASLIFSILFLSSTALAAASGNRVGNGGNAVVCREKEKITRIELLDLYELKTDIPPAVTPSKDKPKFEAEAFKARLELLKKIHPRLANQFTKRLGEMPNEVGFRENVKLADLFDSLRAMEPLEKNCTVEQLAIRQEIVTSGDARFLVSAELWSAMTQRSRSALIAHEMIYEYFFRLGETDSRKARIFNGMLWSDGFAKMTAPDYWKKVRELKIAMYD